MRRNRTRLILCDYDGPLPSKLVSWITQCCRLWQWPLRGIRYDRTRRGWHVLVKVGVRPPLAHVIAAQAIFGSDVKREMLGLMREEAMRRGDVPRSMERFANVLFVSHSRGVNIFDTSKKN